MVALLALLAFTQPKQGTANIERDLTSKLARHGSLLTFKHEGKTILLTLERKTTATAVAAQTASPPKNLTTQLVNRDLFLLVPEGAQNGNLADPDQPHHPRMFAYAGKGQGYSWYARASYEQILFVQQAAGLQQGEPHLQLALRALRVPDSESSVAAYRDLYQMGDKVMTQVAAEARYTPLATQLLVARSSAQSTNAVLNLYRDPEQQNTVETVVAAHPPVEAYRTIYRKGLEKGTIVEAAAAAAGRYRWREFRPPLTRLEVKASDPFTTLLISNSIHKIDSGQDLPSFAKVHQRFQAWTDHDTRAILAAEDHSYPVLVAFGMQMHATKAGAAFADLGRNVMRKLVQRGDGPLIEKLVRRFGLDKNAFIPRS